MPCCSVTKLWLMTLVVLKVDETVAYKEVNKYCINCSKKKCEECARLCSLLLQKHIVCLKFNNNIRGNINL